MRRASAVVCLVAVLAAVPGCVRNESCADSPCPTSKVCHPETLLCVRDEPPKLELTEPREGQVVTGRELIVAGRVSDDGGPVPTLEVTLGENAWRTISADAHGAFSVSFPLPELDAESLAVRVRAVDRLGQKDEVGVEVLIDNVAPTCELLPLRPDEPGVVVGGERLEVRVSAQDGSSIGRARVSVDGGQTFADMSLNAGGATWAWALPQGRSEEVTLKVEVADAHGNVCRAERQVSVMTRAPTLSVISPSGAAPIPLGGVQAGTSMEIRLAVSSELGIRRMSLSEDGGAFLPFNSYGQPEQGIILAAWPMPSKDNAVHEVRFRVEDAAGNVGEVGLELLVDTVPPRIEGLTPTAGEAFNLVRMAGQTVVAVSWTSVDGSPELKRRVRFAQGAGWTPIAADAVTVTTGAQDNGKGYDVFLEVEDGMGNTSSAATHFVVDVVPPTFTATPAQNTRLNEPEISVIFSEPVQAGAGEWLVMNPPASGGSLSGNTFRRGNLTGDTAYAVTVAAGAVADLAGNTNTQTLSRTFHTRVAVPPSGTTLVTGVSHFVAAADQDGVVAVQVERTGGAIQTWWINPRTGVSQMRNSVSSTGSATMHINAFRELNGLAADRVFGANASWNPVNIPAQEMRMSHWFRNDDPPQDGGERLIVPLMPSCWDAPTTGPVGYFDRDTRTYSRPGMSGELAGVRAQVVVPWSRNSFTVAGGTFSSPPTMEVNQRKCDCSSGGSCEWGPSHVLRQMGSGIIQTAAAGNFTFVSYPSLTSGRLVACLNAQPVCTGICAYFPPPAEEAVPNQQVIASWQPSRILSTVPTANGIELRERDVSSQCFPPWTTLGVVPGTNASTQAAPVRIGNRPGVLYLEQGALKVWYLP